MGTAIRGAKFLFSVLQHVLTDQQSARLRLRPLVKTALADWSILANTLASHPVPIASLVPKAPSYVGAVDASGVGCGGFWVDTAFGHLPNPIAFRWPINHHICSLLVSQTNPRGTLSNRDFELAAIVAGATVLQQHANTVSVTAYVASDNTPAVAWCNKGSPSSIGSNAHPLRQLAQLSRVDNMQLDVISVPGDSNLIADFCSRSFHLSDHTFLHQ
jgi:hypothetical protein